MLLPAADEADAAEADGAPGSSSWHAREDGEERLAHPFAAQEQHDPARRPAYGERRSTVLPLHCTVPVRLLDSGQASAATRPARCLRLRRDRGSPRARASRSTGPNRRPRRSETASITSPRSRVPFRSGNASWIGRPIISAIRLSSDIPPRVERALRLSVPQHRHAVDDAEHLRQPVAHVHHPTPLSPSDHELRAGGSTSPGPSAVVGSSRSRTFGLESSDLTTSRSWRSARLRIPHALAVRYLQAVLARASRGPRAHAARNGVVPTVASRGRGSPPRVSSRTCEYAW